MKRNNNNDNYIRYIRPIIFRGDKLSTDKRCFELREAIIHFTKNLVQQLHFYCDNITLATEEGEARGALYGDFSGFYGATPAWHAVMALGAQASYIAAYLIEPDVFSKINDKEWNQIRGKLPADYSTCWCMANEIEACQHALQAIGLACSLLFSGLIDDDLNSLRAKDSAKRNTIRTWGIEALVHLAQLVQSVNEAIKDRLQSSSCPKDDKDLLVDVHLEYEKLLLTELPFALAREVQHKVNKNLKSTNLQKKM